MIEQGNPAPQFTLADESGQSVSLADQAGKWVLFWWYPKASTPG